MIIEKLPFGADLLESITELCIKNDIKLGRIEAIGAMQKSVVGFYNQQSREYEYIDFDEPLELLNLTGNVSLKDSKPFVHAHVTLADDKGQTVGGHLAPGTLIFSCECIIQEITGESKERIFDEETGLFLWGINPSH